MNPLLFSVDESMVTKDPPHGGTDRETRVPKFSSKVSPNIFTPESNEFDTKGRNQKQLQDTIDPVDNMQTIIGNGGGRHDDYDDGDRVIDLSSANQQNSKT